MIRFETAAGLLVDDADRFLLGLRSAGKIIAPSLWDMIGGHLEPGENPRQALDRELCEELGISVADARYVGRFEQIEPPADCSVLHHVFAVTAWAGTPVNNCDEHVAIAWFDIQTIAALPNRTPFDIDLLRLIVKYRSAWT